MKNDRTQRHNTDDIEAMKGLLTEEERKDLIIEETKKSIEFKPIIPLDDSAGSAAVSYTHLDVYKRQAVSTPGLASFGLRVFGKVVPHGLGMAFWNVLRKI